MQVVLNHATGEFEGPLEDSGRLRTLEGMENSFNPIDMCIGATESHQLYLYPITWENKQRSTQIWSALCMLQVRSFFEHTLALSYYSHNSWKDPLVAKMYNLKKPPEPAPDVIALFVSSLRSRRMADFASNALNVAKSNVPLTGECTPDKLVVRKEWGALSAEQRIDYTNAVLCLQGKKAKTPSDLVPGAKSRFDDFISTHINHTFTSHYTASFLLWHRWFIWEYEKALRDECGYKGYQPYWDWAKTAETGLAVSPLFDGSATSLSGNGEYIPSNGTHIDINGIDLPDGTGGGCVKTGPFKNYTVNMGPVSLSLRSSSENGTSIGSTETQWNWNPRCFKRDLTDYSVQRFANETSVRRLIAESKNMEQFEMTMQGYPGSGELGVHGGGHYALGGDPGRDFFVSPGDPAFYLHHSQVDRTWWIWQQQAPSTRCGGPTAIWGTRTFLNEPPSANATYDDAMDLDWAGAHYGEVRKLRDVMSTTAGGFCYVYE